MATNDRLADLLEKQTELLSALVSAQGGGQAQKQAAFSTYTPLHGPGGIWTGGGLEREIVTAHMRPQSIASRLPLLPTVYTNPLFGVLTGYTGTTGSQPANACDAAPTGYVKGCTLTARTGRIRFDSQTIDIDDVMLRLHRGDFTDLQLMGKVLGLTNLPPTIQQGDILNIVSASEMTIVAVNTERELARQMWQGTTAVANEFPGLDAQIATGHIDAQSGQACPAVDSDVKNFAYDLIGGGGRDIVEYLSMMEFYLRYNADSMGLSPVSWVVAMRPELWFELTAIWPCAYNTSKCAPAVIGAASSVFIDGRENVAERDAMRNGLYIDINGNRYPVVLDTGIFESNNINDANVPAGHYASSIYFVPLTINGGFPVTYREHIDYKQAASDLAYTNGKLALWWTDNGAYSWTLEQTRWCYLFSMKTEQRVVLRTPHLAGRIDDVRYSPLQHLRDTNPSDPYWVDGGVSLRANDPGYQAVWLS